MEKVDNRSGWSHLLQIGENKMSKVKLDVVMVKTKVVTVEADNALQARKLAEKRENRDKKPDEWFATSVYQNPSER